jgi:hypothetical protein
MTWFINHYHCTDCGTKWSDEWSCCCDDECPNCGSRNWSPVDSDDLSVIVSESGGEYFVLQSPPEVEEDKPRYRVVGRAETMNAAMALAGNLNVDR